MKNRKKNDFEKICKYCERATELSDADTMLCPKYGVVQADNDCHRFIYDPLKRCPPKPVKPEAVDFDEIFPEQ